jgi:hypothetical protein
MPEGRWLPSKELQYVYRDVLLGNRQYSWRNASVDSRTDGRCIEQGAIPSKTVRQLLHEISVLDADVRGGNSGGNTNDIITTTTSPSGGLFVGCKS